MEWLNEPASWQRTGDVLTVSVDPGTDFWRETGYGYIRDSGHVYGEVLAGDLDVYVRMRYTLGAQYDQAGVMLRADARTWLKTGVEFFEGRARLSTVLTLGRSSWMVTDLPAGTDDVALRVSRRGDAVEVRYQVGDGPAELAALVFLPPGREVLAGVMAAAPEGPGFRVTFQDLRITERDWSGPAGKDTAWQDDQAEWAAEEASGWSPVDGGPGWMAPVAGEDDPDWPATVAGTQSPGWPAPDEDLGWAAPAGGEEDPGWPARAGGEEDPGWPAAGMGDDEPGWAAAAVATAGPESAALDEAGLDGPTLDGLGQEEPAQDDSGQDDSGWPGAADAGAADGGDSDAGDSEAEPAVAEHGGPQPVKARSAGDEHAVDEPAAPEPAEPEDSGLSDLRLWSPAPVTGLGARTGRAASNTADVDPALDWERLAAGAQTARDEAIGTAAARWRAETDAEVANEWPGPPLRAAMRTVMAAAMPGPSAADPEADAQTDPGLPRPRLADPAEEEPGQPEGGAAVPEGGTEPAADAGTPDEGEPTPAREPRWGRSKRATADLPAEPDAADEWISLLTADPVEE